MAMAQLPLQKEGRPGTGIFIKGYLQRVKEDYVYHIYKAFRKFIEANGHRGPSYESFRKYFGVCVQLNLIEFVRSEPPAPGKQHLFPRRYFRVVQRNLNSEAWENPQAALDLQLGHTLPDPMDPSRRVAVRALGKRRYQRWLHGDLPKSADRPKKL